MRRIGLFGGSFNPIHNGHLHLIQTAQHCLRLEKVILIPAWVSPFKQQYGEMASAQDRLAMCRLAAQTLPYCSVDSFELERKDVSYTIYTVEYFHQKFPESELVLLMGSDMFLSFPQWYRWQGILKITSLGIVSRETDDWEKLEDQRDFIQQYGTSYLCQAQAYPISSTKIRENFKKNKDSSCYLPEKVVQYILSHQLYQEHASNSSVYDL